MVDKTKKLTALAAFVIYACFYLGNTSSLVGQVQMQSSAQANVPFSKWRPTREQPGRSYVGAATCAKCHTYQAEHFFTTPMSHALESVSDCDILIKRPRLTFTEGPFSYQITRQGNRSIYTVSDGTNT